MERKANFAETKEVVFMEKVITVIIMCAIGCSLGLSIVLVAEIWSSYSTHKYMMEGVSGLQWDYVSFDKFQEEFNKVKWRIDPLWPQSRMSEENSKFHADIIIINGKGMIIKWHDILKYKRFKKRKKKEAMDILNLHSTRVDGLWDKTNEGLKIINGESK